ncbi:MAG: hypothetical protein LLF94_05025, partial [Chlamydiales bacterium]|nr:hypothetical protein [Chlamydiales bacterium]
KTAWKWILEAKWIEDFAKIKPKPKIINATEGGLGLQNIPDMSLKEVSQKYLTVARDLDSLVHTAIQDVGIIDDTAKMIVQGCTQMYDSLERVKAHLDALCKTLTNNINDSEVVLLQSELKEEIAYQYILEVFDKMRIKLEHYRLQFKAHPQIDEKTMQAFEIELLLERYKFLYETAQINQVLIVQSIENEKSKGRDVSLFCPKAPIPC